MAKMQPRHVNLRGLSAVEAEAEVRKLIDDVQSEALENSEIMLIDLGASPDELAAELARQRAENVRMREQAIERMRGLAERDGRTLN
jgi:hypothetical protein